ncbi:MAG: hypothetical protein AAF329_16635 [Cyanobacteria bacterium P01_A01_bin.17]
MANLTDNFQFPNIKTTFDPTFSGWVWSLQTQCEGTVDSDGFYDSEEDAIAEAMELWRQDQKQKTAWNLVNAALLEARSQGISEQVFFKGLSWLYSHLPEFRQTSTAPGKELQILIARDLLKDALLASQQQGVDDYNFLQGFAWLCYQLPSLSSVVGRIERATYSLSASLV